MAKANKKLREEDIPKPIKDKVFALVDVSGKTFKTLLKQLLEIVEHHKGCQKVEGDFKYQVAYTILHKRYCRSTEEKVEVTKQKVKPKHLIKKVKENFSSPKLMILIQNELGKRHIGNPILLMATFVTMCTSRLKPNDRNSLAIRGGTCEGKTDSTKTCLAHIPEDWYAFGTRFTRATIEDDIAPFNLLIILEKPQDETVTEVIKQVSEDGLKVWKKDQSEANKGKLKEAQNIPRKTVIYTSTEDETDVELATRFLIGNIESDPKRYEEVVNKYKKQNVYIDEAIEIETQKQGNTWIKEGLKTLRTDFDFIIIPYLNTIPIRTDVAESQRDSKRFVNMIKAIAWLNQKNRLNFEYKGKKILIASVEDGVWADHLTKKSFLEGSSGLSESLQELYDTIKEMSESSESKAINIDSEELANFIDRTLVQKKLRIKSVDTIKNKCDALENLNLLETYKEHNFSRTYVRTINNPLKHPLIAYDSPTIWLLIKKFEKLLYEKWLVANSYPISSHLVGRLVGISSSITPYSISNLLTKSNNIQEENEKDYEKYDFDALCLHISEKISSLDKKHTKNDDSAEQKTLPLNGKMVAVKKIIDENPDDNYNLVLKEFGKEFIDHNIAVGTFFEISKGKQLEFIAGGW